MLYDVRKETKSRYSEDKSTNEDIQSALNSWDGKGANIIPKINCDHVTINGMNNDYDTASKLIGVHTDVAYRKDNIVRYNLFHNPTDGGFLIYQSVSLIKLVYLKVEMRSNLLL